MKKIRWQLVIILLTGLVVGVLLITQKQPAANALLPQPTSGGVYTEGLVGSLKRLNPLLDSYNAPDRDVDHLIFSGLVSFDSRGQPQADLAGEWAHSNDGTIFSFKLRPGLVWQDGKPLTSDDVVFTYNLLKNPSSVIPKDIQAFWKDIEIKKLDDQNLQFRLPEAFAPFMDYASVGILPKHLLGDLTIDKIVDSPFNTQPVGSGPFRLDHLVVENNKITGVVLASFDKYYGQKPYIQQFVFRYYDDSQSIFKAYQAGEVQGISQVTPDIMSSVLSDSNLALYTGREPDMTMVLFNLNDPNSLFFQDSDVRQALLTGLNRQAIVDKVLKGQAIVANGPLFPDTWAYYSGLSQTAYDPTAAAQLLTTAGYSLPTDGNKIWKKGDTEISFQLLYPEGNQYKAVADSIVSDWTKLGIHVTTSAVSYDDLINNHLSTHAYQAALVDLNLTGSPDPDPYPFWDQAQINGGENYSQWDNRAASEYIEQARITVNQADREKLYKNFQVLFIKETPALPLYYPVYTYAVDRQVQGVQMGPLIDASDRFSTVTSWFMVAKKPGQTTPSVVPTQK